MKHCTSNNYKRQNKCIFQCLNQNDPVTMYVLRAILSRTKRKKKEGIRKIFFNEKVTITIVQLTATILMN